MADGSGVTSYAICPKVSWRIQKYHFTYDLKIMELGGLDIILGVDWMFQFSPVVFYFHQLNITLTTIEILWSYKGK